MDGAMIIVAIGDTVEWKNGVTCVRESERIVCLWTVDSGPAPALDQKPSREMDVCVVCRRTKRNNEKQ